MFDKLKAMGQMAALLKDKDKIKEITGRVKARAAEVRAIGESGAGAVRVTADGQMRVLKVEMQPALVAGMAADERTRELAGTLIADAVNDAIRIAQASMKVVLEREAKELGLPELPGDLAGMLS